MLLPSRRLRFSWGKSLIFKDLKSRVVSMRGSQKRRGSNDADQTLRRGQKVLQIQSTGRNISP